MNSDQETESPEMCSEESTHTVKESVEKLFSLINTEFSRPSVPDEEEDFSLLKQICEAKANILKDNPYWSIFDDTTLLSNRALVRLDWLDAEGQWDGANNIENYKVIKEALRDLRGFNPNWKLEEQEIIRRVMCSYCGTVKSIPDKKTLPENNPEKAENQLSSRIRENSTP
jgi:hypothetical protein